MYLIEILQFMISFQKKKEEEEEDKKKIHKALTNAFYTSFRFTNKILYYIIRLLENRIDPLSRRIDFCR